MTPPGLVDWRGNPINKNKHGGFRAALFLYFMVVVTNVAVLSNLMNLVTYLHGTLHAGIASSSNIVTNFFSAMAWFSLLGAFISDSYVTRFKTILIFGPLEILGYGLLALQAHLPSLRPPKCDINAESNNCVRVHGLNAALLYTGLYVVAVGEGGIRACLASLGGDQFDDDDPVELQQKASFFNWFTFGISLGGFIGLVLVVWIMNNKGWDVGFGVCSLVVLCGMAVVASAFPFYRNRIPQGSPLTRMLQVFVAAFKKRKLMLPGNLEEMKQAVREDTNEMEVLPRTKDFKFLDKAWINYGDTGPWSYCTVNQVEETKIVLRMLPIFISAAIGYIPVPLLLTFTVQQGGTMDTRLGKIHIAPASLFVIPITFQMLSLAVFDRLFVPFLRRITGYVAGITNLQRVGVGFASTIIATGVAALVEMKRKRVAEEHGLMNAGTGIPMTVLWLGVQFFFLGIVDVTSFVGLLEFCTNEVSTGMRSLGTAIFWCILGLASLFGTIIVDVVNQASRHGYGGRGWLEGNNLNKSHLERFYWLLAALELAGLLNFLYWASKYVYRQDPRIKETGEVVVT